MSQKIARYVVTHGLAGCYMPDSHYGAFEFHTRKELADFIKSELRQLEWPQRLFYEMRIRNLWRFIARNGSSVAHFSITHKGYSLAFHGLTREEYKNEIGE